GGRIDFLDPIARHANDPIAIAEHQVARYDHHSIDGDRHVDFARPILVRTAMGDSDCEDWEFASRDRRAVAYGTVYVDSRETRAFGVSRGVFPDDGVGHSAARVDDDDVAWLGNVEGLMQHEVVARARLDGHGRTGKDAAGMHRPQIRAAGAHPIHGVADARHRKIPVAVDDIDADLCAARKHAKADSH